MKRKKKNRPARRSRLPEEPLFCGRHPDLSDEAFEEFMKRVHAFESAPTTTLARLLIRDGVELPPPEAFTEESVHEKLWEVIHGMESRRHFLESTDHLTDLALYRHLWEKTLNEPTEEVTEAMGDCACHIDLLGDGSEESIRLWLCYHASEADRAEWARNYPDDPMPAHIDPPCDRDRHLPKRFA